MSNSLPTINPDNYESQHSYNNEKMQKLLETLFPELKVPYDTIFQILSYLQDTGVNGMILPQVIRGIYNLHIGSGEGQVIVHVKNGVTNVQNRENNKEVELIVRKTTRIETFE